MSPVAQVKKDPAVWVAVAISVVMCTVSLASYAGTSTKELEIRTRNLEIRLPTIEAKLDGIAKQQDRIVKLLEKGNNRESFIP